MDRTELSYPKVRLEQVRQLNLLGLSRGKLTIYSIGITYKDSIPLFPANQWLVLKFLHLYLEAQDHRIIELRATFKKVLDACTNKFDSRKN